MNLKKEEIKNFRIKLDENLRKFYPQVFENQIKITFHEVCYSDEGVYIIENRFVMELEIFSDSKSRDLYLTQEKRCFLKRLGSLHLLKINEVIEYVRRKIVSFKD